MLFFLLKQTVRAAIQAVSHASCTESTKHSEDSSSEAEVAQEAEVTCSSLDALEGTSLQETSEVSQMLSTHEDDVSESKKKSLNDCATCAVMASKIRQLEDKVKSLQGMYICAHLTAMFALSVPCLRPLYFLTAPTLPSLRLPYFRMRQPYVASALLRPPYAAPTIPFMV